MEYGKQLRIREEYLDYLQKISHRTMRLRATMRGRYEHSESYDTFASREFHNALSKAQKELKTDIERWHA